MDLIKSFIFNGSIFFLNEDCWIMDRSILAYNKPQTPNPPSSSLCSSSSSNTTS